MISAVTVLALVAAVLISTAVVGATRARAAGAADLAALAAAGAAPLAGVTYAPAAAPAARMTGACQHAVAVAAANGAALQQCVVRSRCATVTVRVAVRVLGISGGVTATARAGPSAESCA